MTSSSPPSPEPPGRLAAALRAGADYIARYARSLSVDPELLRAAALQIETLEKERDFLAVQVSVGRTGGEAVAAYAAKRDAEIADLRLQVETLTQELKEARELYEANHG